MLGRSRREENLPGVLTVPWAVASRRHRFRARKNPGPATQPQIFRGCCYLGPEQQPLDYASLTLTHRASGNLAPPIALCNIPSCQAGDIIQPVAPSGGGRPQAQVAGPRPRPGQAMHGHTPGQAPAPSPDACPHRGRPAAERHPGMVHPRLYRTHRQVGGYPAMGQALQVEHQDGLTLAVRQPDHHSAARVCPQRRRSHSARLCGAVAKGPAAGSWRLRQVHPHHAGFLLRGGEGRPVAAGEAVVILLPNMRGPGSSRGDSPAPWQLQGDFHPRDVLVDQLIDDVGDHLAAVEQPVLPGSCTWLTGARHARPCCTWLPAQPPVPISGISASRYRRHCRCRDCGLALPSQGNSRHPAHSRMVTYLTVLDLGGSLCPSVSRGKHGSNFFTASTSRGRRAGSAHPGTTVPVCDLEPG